MKQVDIVIAVYNGYDYLKACIESVIKHTDLKTHRVIIIDDKSPDKKTHDYIESLKDKQNFEIIMNAENVGFVANSNKGMQMSKSDIILLNTDTVVTESWIEKLQNCAYSREKVATVTPLSNNAYLTSVPYIARENELPEGVSIDEMGKIVQKVSFKSCPEIPVGHGFCMYVKREIIDEIGVFDLVAFGRGYGEEVDFCLRAQQKGYVNLAADDTYIYHKGSVSFTSAVRNERVEKSTQLINARYPAFDAQQRDFVRQNPLENIQNNIKLALSNFLNESHRKKILFIKHHEDTVGGIGMNTMQIIRNVSKDYSCYLLTPEHNGSNCSHFTLSQYISGDLMNKWEFNGIDVNALISEIVNNFEISLIHVQFLLAQINIEELKKIDIPKVVTFHENSLISPGNPFLTKHQSIKGVHEFFPSLKDYLEALEDNEHIALLKKFAEKVDAFDKVLVPSKYMADQYNEVFKAVGIHKKIEIVELGHELGKSALLREINLDKPLKIAYVGHATQHKGVLDLIRLAADNRLKSKAKFYIFGVVNFNTYNAARLLGKISALLNITNAGVYNYDNLREKFEKNAIDIGVILSPWGEAYSYTLSDCIQCNIPVIGRNLGAVGQRITENGYGWTFNNYEDLVATIEKIYSDRRELREKTGNAVSHTIIPVSEMAANYESKYTELINKHNCSFIAEPQFNLTAFMSHSTMYNPSFKRKVKSKIKSAPFGKTLRNVYLEINHLIKDRK